MSIISNFKNSDFFQNFVNLSLNQGFSLIATLIYTPFIFKTIGEESFGDIHLAFSIVMILTTIVHYGYNLNGPKIIADSRIDYSINRFISEILSLRIIVSITLIIILLPFLFYNYNDFNKILVYSLSILICESLNPLFYLQGINKIFPYSILNFFSKSLMIIFFFLIIEDNIDSYLVNFIYALSILIFYIIFWWNFHLKIGLFFNIKLKRIKIKIIENFKFFMSSIYDHLTVNSALILLAFFVSDKELGRFTLSYKVAFLLRMIPVFFVQSALQNATVLRNSEQLMYEKYVQKNYRMGLISTFFLALVTILFSDVIIFYFSGELIPYSSKVLKILSVIPFLAMLNFKNITFLLVNNLKSILNKSTFITLNLMFIYCLSLSFFFGGIGISYALILTEISCFLVFFYQIKKYKIISLNT